MESENVEIEDADDKVARKEAELELAKLEGETKDIDKVGAELDDVR